MSYRKPPFMGAADVRRAFLDFFRERGHRVVASSSLVPGNDPTLLFTNAGMVQFKDLFLGKEKRDYVRATSSQRCVRAGGKHNDLENVGYTARHHTFFEMLGNFSFGDYFKRDAIAFAWEFVTGKLGLDPARLWVTVFQDDEEAAALWRDVAGVQPERIVRLGEKSNFWAMGDTGPCGPCTEIFYDHGPTLAGGPPGSPDEDGDRYVEIWNLVFMQFERDADGSMKPLPKPSVDTGAGLERMAAVMQGVQSNYDIDLFKDLIAAAAAATGTTDLKSPSLRVIADHIRACSFLVSDGVVPSNEGRGYVLRRIARRAMRHGHKLGQSGLFFYKLVPVLSRVMGEAYPELVERAAQIEKVLLVEEEQFSLTLAKGMALLETEFKEARRVFQTVSAAIHADPAAGVRLELPGYVVFKLHDTYGFPPDLTADIARERGFGVDMIGYEREMNAQRDRGRAASKFSVDLRGGADLNLSSEFTGYSTTSGEARVAALLRDGAIVDQLNAGESGEVVLERTPFYAESGGQVGDTGALSATNGSVRFMVGDTQKRGHAHSHLGKLDSGTLRVGTSLNAQVDAGRRDAIRLNHSATHLLHAALRRVLGTHVTQKGSLVAPDRLRFDFGHFQAVTPEELAAIESLVNEQVRGNAAAETRVMGYEQAVAAGAMALFGEKYDSEVRVLGIGEFSTELCGGTHVNRAGDIGLLRILSESGVAAGVRRIEAVTGAAALAHIARNEQRLREVAALVRGSPDDVTDKVREQLERTRGLEKELRTLKDKLAAGAGNDLAGSAIEVNGAQVVVAAVEGGDAAALRSTADQLKGRFSSAVIVLATAVSQDKVLIVAAVTADLSAQIKAGELVSKLAARLGGKGGGKPDFAQGAGASAVELPAALAEVTGLIRERLTKT
jgi:alanyl-tRNA synthetase